MRIVFISYSRKDQREFDELMPFLAALKGCELLEVWHDGHINLGDDWRVKIDQALEKSTVGILLISQYFLASSFIMNNELPYLLEKANSGKLRLLPLFISPSTVDQTCPDLIKFQGCGTPDQPLSKYNKTKRKEFYQKLCKQIVAPEKEDRFHRPPVVTTQEGSEYLLIVSLTRHGDQFETRYALPGRDWFYDFKRPWADIEKSARSMLDMLDERERDKFAGRMQTAPRSWGKVLFEILFGSERGKQDLIFATVFGRLDSSVAPAPSYAPLRLRIATEETELCALPWWATTWNDIALIDIGWRFLPGQDENSRNDVVTKASCEVLLVSGMDAAAGSGSHLNTIEATLASFWFAKGQRARRVQNRMGLFDALDCQRPHLVYIHGKTEIDNGRPCLSLGDEKLPLEGLAQHLRGSTFGPGVIFLNIENHVGADACALLYGTAPMLIVRRSPESPDDPGRLPINFISYWLRTGKDPIVAWHDICRERDQPEYLEAQVFMINANYRHWRTDRALENTREKFSHLRLDREKQKTMATKWLAELAGDEHLRVMALVPHGAPGNRLQDLHEQLCDYAKAALAGRLAIELIRLQFPESRESLSEDLEHEFAIQMQIDVDGGETSAQALRRHARRIAHASGCRPVVWLHWGTFGKGLGYEPPLIDGDLEQWLNFTGTYLTQHCPDEMRLICSLTIESHGEEQGRLRQILKQKVRDLDDPKYWLKRLEPVDNVDEEELYDFLKSDIVNCPPQLRSEMTDLLSRESQGNFERLVELIESAEKTSWPALIEKLRRITRPRI